jgi:hypothetical protein
MNNKCDELAEAFEKETGMDAYIYPHHIEKNPTTKFNLFLKGFDFGVKEHTHLLNESQDKLKVAVEALEEIKEFGPKEYDSENEKWNNLHRWQIMAREALAAIGEVK